MRNAVKKDPEYSKARFYFVSMLERRQLCDELLEVAREGTLYNPEEAIYWFYLGEVSIRKGNIEDGLAAHRRCLMLNPPAKARERSIEQINKLTRETE